MVLFNLIFQFQGFAEHISGVSKHLKYNEAYCDEYDVTITGRRYKCLTCYDYDLCEMCENQGAHPQHNMLLIRKPLKPKKFSFIRKVFKK